MTVGPAEGAHTRLKFQAGIIEKYYKVVNIIGINNLARYREYCILNKPLIIKALTVIDT
jgi:hypothetical protein